MMRGDKKGASLARSTRAAVQAVLVLVLVLAGPPPLQLLQPQGPHQAAAQLVLESIQDTPMVALRKEAWTFTADFSWDASLAAYTNETIIYYQILRGSRPVVTGNFSAVDPTYQALDTHRTFTITDGRAGYHQYNLEMALQSNFTDPATKVTTLSFHTHVIYGGLSLLPPLFTIAVVVATRNVLLSLFTGVFMACFIIYRFNPIAAFSRSFDTMILDALADRGHAQVILFTWFLSGMVACILKSGGGDGLVRAFSRFARTPRAGAIITMGLGLLIFFDGIANTLIVGQTVRPITDTLRISREKLAFLVDATSSPVTSVSPISTWVGFELSLIENTLKDLANSGADVSCYDSSAFVIFVKTIPARFYPFIMIALQLLLIVCGREFGPMLAAERRARASKPPPRPRGSHGGGSGASGGSDGGYNHTPALTYTLQEGEGVGSRPQSLSAGGGAATARGGGGKKGRVGPITRTQQSDQRTPILSASANASGQPSPRLYTPSTPVSSRSSPTSSVGRMWTVTEESSTAAAAAADNAAARRDGVQDGGNNNSNSRVSRGASRDGSEFQVVLVPDGEVSISNRNRAPATGHHNSSNDNSGGGDGAGEGSHLEVGGDDDLQEFEPDPDTPKRWWNAAVPVIITTVMVLVALIVTGVDACKQQGLSLSGRNIFGNSDSYDALLYGSVLGTLTIWLLTCAQRVDVSGNVTWFNRKFKPLQSLKASLDTWVAGVRSLTFAVLVLLLAWAVGAAFTACGTANFVSASLAGSVQAGAYPALTFLLSAVLAFVTGSSWGTMGIVFPLILPAAHEAAPCNRTVFYGTIASILAGAVFGDHCSPISDTTILSSIACRCNLTAHVKTQAPYALLAGTCGFLFGDLPTGYGAYPEWVGLVLSVLAALVSGYVLSCPVEDADRVDLVTQGWGWLTLAVGKLRRRGAFVMTGYKRARSREGSQGSEGNGGVSSRGGRESAGAYIPFDNPLFGVGETAVGGLDGRRQNGTVASSAPGMSSSSQA